MTASDENANPAGGVVLAPAAQPDRCLARIGQVRRRWLVLHRLLAVSLLLAVVSVSAAIVVGIDGWWRGERPARLLLLLAGVATVVGASRRWVAPLWGQVSRGRAALLLERAYPELAGRLVTAVELAAPAVRDRAGTSHDLYRQVCGAAEQSAARLDVVRALPGRLPLLRSAIAGGIVLALLVMAAFNRLPASTGIARILMPWREINWPQRTQLAIDAGDEPIRVVRGGTLTLTGGVRGDIPVMGTLHVQSGTGAEDQARFDIGDEGAFAVRYRPVNHDLAVWLEVGDARSRVIHVEMVLPPEVVAIEAECVYPDYTGLDRRQIADGNVQAVFESQIRLHVTTNKPVAKASFAWDEQTPLPMELTGEKEAEIGFGVEASRSYRIHLIDRLGFRNAEPVVYRIEMIDNLYPRIERATPTTNKKVTPLAIVPITAEVTDDFSVAEVTLCYRRGQEQAAQRIPIPLEHTGKRVAVRHLWSLEPLALEPDQTLTYWLEARDVGQHAERSNWPVSRSRLLRVMDEPELARMLSEDLEQILDGLAELEVLQDECASAVERINRSIDAPPTSSGALSGVRQRTRAEKWRQDHLARRGGRLAVRLGGVAEDYIISRIGQPERAQRLQHTADQLARIAGTDMPGIALLLDEALLSLRKLVMPTTQPREEP